jgi:hypothetical protein
MNQVTMLQSAFTRHAWQEQSAERCDLPLLADIVINTMRPVLLRRRQIISIAPSGCEVVVTGELRVVFSLLSAVLLEGAGLSSADARLRIAFDIDDGDAVVTLVGTNQNRLPSSLMRIDGELAQLARESGTELDLLWDEAEGPTLVLRFLKSRTDIVH